MNSRSIKPPIRPLISGVELESKQTASSFVMAWRKGNDQVVAGSLPKMDDMKHTKTYHNPPKRGGGVAEIDPNQVTQRSSGYWTILMAPD